MKICNASMKFWNRMFGGFVGGGGDLTVEDIVVIILELELQIYLASGGFIYKN